MGAGDGAGFDQPAHRGAVAGQVALDDVGGIGVRIEVHDADVAVSVYVGDRGGRGPGDGVVAAEDDRARCRGTRWWHPFLDVGVRHLGLAVRAVGVAEVDDLEPVEDLQAEVEVVGARLVGGGADGPRTEPGARAVGGPDVERRADDRDVGPPRVELLGFGQERSMPERHHARVRDFELFNHAGRQFARSGWWSWSWPMG